MNFHSLGSNFISPQLNLKDRTYRQMIKRKFDHILPSILTLIVIKNNLTDSSQTPRGINRFNNLKFRRFFFQSLSVKPLLLYCCVYCVANMGGSFPCTHAAFPHRSQRRWIAAETPTWSRLCCHAAWRIWWVERADLEAADPFYRTAWTLSSKKPKTNLKVTTAVPHQNTLSWPVGR